MSIRTSIFALLYDAFLAPAERKGMRSTRRQVLADATGRTLELGAGTGLNLALYPTSVASLTLTEPDPAMTRRLRRKTGRDDLQVDVVQASGEELPFADQSFDTVVCTMVLCTVADLATTLQEIRRVLAPGGRLLLIEHVRSPEVGLARWQDRLHGPWQAFACGCHCNLDTTGALRLAGFDVDALRPGTWRGVPAIVQPTIAGCAVRW